jgi:hypothetical protein
MNASHTFRSAAPPERFSVRVVESGVERLATTSVHNFGSCCQSAGSRDRWLRGDTTVRGRGTNRRMPCSSHAAVSEAHESASARMAEARVLVGCGKAHAFPSVIDPNPHASRRTSPDGNRR